MENKIGEFKVARIKSLRNIYIEFNKSVFIISLRLTYKEWDNLFNFLKTTKSKTHLPKHKIQYTWFDMETNKCEYIDSRPYYIYSKYNFPKYAPMKLDIIKKSYPKSLRMLFEKSNKSNIRFNQKWAENDRKWEKQRKENDERQAKLHREDAKNNLVSKEVSLRSENFVVRMQRKQFLRFRDYCLNKQFKFI